MSNTTFPLPSSSQRGDDGLAAEECHRGRGDQVGAPGGGGAGAGHGLPGLQPTLSEASGGDHVLEEAPRKPRPHSKPTQRQKGAEAIDSGYE